MAETSSSTTVSTKLERIAKLAREMPQAALTTLAHYIDIDWLREAYRRTRSQSMSMWWVSVVNAACGIPRASFAIRLSFVDTVVELDVSAIFPSNVPVSRCFLPSTGSLGSVPPLRRYCKALRLPAAPPALLRFLRFAVPPLRLGLRSRSRKTLQLRAWGCSPESPNRTY